MIFITFTYKARTMNVIRNLLYLLLIFPLSLLAQVEQEVAPPFSIKTVSFVQQGQNVVPFFRLGEGFELHFDDLYGNEEDYFYTLTHCDYNWRPSNLSKNDYLLGFDNFRIQDFENSINTLQHYTHYTLRIPNSQTQQLKVSGNYILKIFNSSQELVFSRRFVVYETAVSVPVQIKRSRTMSLVEQMHNVDFSVKASALQLQNPNENVKIAILQNALWHTAIKNIKPQYTLGGDLIYKYDKETSFYAGNENYYIETKDIRVGNNTVSHVTSGDLYNTYLYANQARKNQVYTYYPDINGGFITNVILRNKPNVEADYSWVYFTLSAPDYFGQDGIYIGGMFNNYALTDEYKMEYDSKEGLYKKALLIKQGFTNYQYLLAKNNVVNSKDAIDGNFYQTENDYYVLVYYRGTTDRHDRIIGIGQANSVNITN